MQGSWLDFLPSNERTKLRKRMRSPEAYEALRAKVKGPEDLEREMKKSEALAEFHFALESEPQMQDALKQKLQEDIKQHGIESVLDVQKLSPSVRAQIEQGKFRVAVSAHPQMHQDALTVLPEGNVPEKIPLKPTFSNQYTSQFLQM